MISLHNRVASSLCLGVLLLSLGFVSSCQPKSPDAREEFVRSLKGANVDGYLFATKEDDNQVTTSLTNGALRNPVKFDGAGSVVIGYASVKDKKTNATKTFKAEILKAGKNYTLQIADTGAGGATTKLDFPTAKPCDPPQPVFNTGQDCNDDFKCRVFPGLLREANRTCRVQLFDLLCCLKDGSAFEALMIIRPTELRCLIAFPFDIDTVFVSR
jgi:hypothetical protein